MQAKARLIALGWSRGRAVRAVFPPFIVVGFANWIDTWGAPRFGPGPIVRTHEGQDVFCRYGAPVLATEGGVVEFASGGLGGKIARLHRGDGTYWYYAHLSGWSASLASGDRVEMGDVIGYCGNSGDAISTPPHVHFGWYTPGGARDPMESLVGWLEEAERRANRLVQRVTTRRMGSPRGALQVLRAARSLPPPPSSIAFRYTSSSLAGVARGPAASPPKNPEPPRRPAIPDPLRIPAILPPEKRSSDDDDMSDDDGDGSD